MDENERIAIAVLERDFMHLDKGLSDVKTEVKEVKVELKEVRTEMRQGFQLVDAKIEKLSEKIDSKFLWMLGALGSVVALFMGFIYFFFGKPAAG